MNGSRRAAVLLEVMVAVALLAAMFSVCLQALTAMARQRQVIARRACAVQEAANLLEQWTVRDWAAVTPEAVQSLDLSDEAKRMLPAGRLQVEVVPAGNGPDAKRITVVVRWQNRPGQQPAPVRLSAWVYGKGAPVE